MITNKDINDAAGHLREAAEHLEKAFEILDKHLAWATKTVKPFDNLKDRISEFEFEEKRDDLLKFITVRPFIEMSSKQYDMIVAAIYAQTAHKRVDKALGDVTSVYNYVGGFSQPFIANLEKKEETDVTD